MSWIKRGLIHAAYYPTLGFNYAMIGVGLWRHWSWVDPQLLLGAAPTREQFPQLKKLGITAVVNMCEEFAGDLEALAEHGFEQLHLPTLDYHCPSAENLHRGVEFITESIARGSKVYLHCKAGRLRSPCVAVCYLMRARHVSARVAYRMVRAVRWHINRRIDRFPAIVAFEEALKLEKRLDATGAG